MADTIAKENTEYIDRPFNIRPLCLWAFFALVTVVMCLWSWIAAAIWIFTLFVFLFACQFIKTKDKVLQFFGTSRAFFVGSVAVCLAVVLSFGITNIVYANQKSFSGNHTLTGVLESYRIIDDEWCAFTLGNATFDDNSVSGRVSVYLNDPKNANEMGLVFGARVTIENTRLVTAKANERNINSRVKYTANVDSTNFAVVGQSNELRHVISRYSKNFLNKHLGDTNAELMYSMLFGDKSALDGEIRDNFAVTGLAHVLAVSGLHVGLIIGMLMAVLKLCRLRRKYQFPIVLVVLLFYCYLCDFNFPIVRASIMFLIVLANRIYLRNADLLSSTCAAAVVTLVIFPYAISSVSFQLSYACMFGIALFMRPVENLLNRTVITKAPNIFQKIQRYLNKGVAMYVCVTIATLPLLVKYFGAVPLLGLVGNLLIVPVLVLCFQVVVIALVTWIGFGLLYPINYLIDFVRWSTNALANLPVAQIHVQNGGYWYLLYFAAVILMTRFVFLPRKVKYTASLTFMCVYMMSFLM